MIGRGGEGTVFRVEGICDRYGNPLAFKQYHASVIRSIDVEVLEHFATFGRSLAAPTAGWLHRRAAWPTWLVEDRRNSRRPLGLLMPLAGAEFNVDLHRSAGGSMRVPARMELLLNGEEFGQRVGLRVTPRQRMQLLLDLAETLSFLHTSGFAVGDFSCKNLLFRLDPKPTCLMLDCDSMFWSGRTALPPGETPEWELPAGESPGRPPGDVYKFGLLALRLHSGAQHHRDPSHLPGGFPADVRQLVERSLSADARRRPLITEWTQPLRAAAEVAEDRLPALAPPARSSSTAGPRGARPVPVKPPIARPKPRYRPAPPPPRRVSVPVFGGGRVGLAVGGVLRRLLFRKAAVLTARRLAVTVGGFLAACGLLLGLMTLSGVDITRMGRLSELVLVVIVAALGAVAFTLGTTEPA
jgi:hypothetical protein